jgi:hypothetical protein
MACTQTGALLNSRRNEKQKAKKKKKKKKEKRKKKKRKKKKKIETHTSHVGITREFTIDQYTYVWT